MTPQDTVNRDKLPVTPRRRRGFGAVERLPSGRIRARVLGPDGRYVSAPATFASRTDAAVWVDVQRTDLVRGLWKPPARRRGSAKVGDYVRLWIIQPPSARSSTKELYGGLLRTCIAPDLGRWPVAELTPERVRRWHFELGERLASDADRRRAELRARGRDGSAVSVTDGRSRQAQAYRLLRAAMSTAVTDGVIDSQPCRIPGAGSPAGCWAGPRTWRTGCCPRPRWLRSRRRCRPGTGRWCWPPPGPACARESSSP